MATPPPLTFADIERVLAVTDELELDRERVKIPLRRAPGGRIAKDARGGLEIVVDADRPFEEWLADLPAAIRRVTG